MALKTRPIGMIVGSSVYFSLLLSLNGAPALGRKSDAELSRALIGTWEVKLSEQYYIPSRFFASVKPDGTYKLIAISDFLAFQGRAERQGKWRVADGRLITQRDVGSATPLRYEDEVRDRILLRGDTVILLTNNGQEYLHKAPIPAELPALLPPDWMDKFIVEKQKPDYPIEARRLRYQGQGFFALHINQKTGTVESVGTVRSTSHPVLDQAAINALKRWRIKARTIGILGIPIEFILTKPQPIDSVVSVISP